MQAAAVATTPIVPNTVMPVPDAPSSGTEPSDFARQLDLASTAGEPEAAPPVATEDAAPEPTPPVNDVATLLAGLQWLTPQPAELAKQAAEAVDGENEEPDAALLSDAAAAAQAVPALTLPVAPLAQPMPALAPAAAPLASAASAGMHTTDAVPAARSMREASAPGIKPTPEDSEPVPLPALRSATFEMTSAVMGNKPPTDVATEVATRAATVTYTPNSMAALAMAQSPIYNTAPSAAAPFHAALTVALGSPEFAPALSTQVSMLVRDGIGEARLHLHPAELGPISVQIALDGRQAQVNMSAEHALTRQALEQALPTLASALRDAGLTLSGGGVFQHPPQQGQREAPDTARGQAQRGVLVTEGEQRHEVRVLVQQGAVDLYA